MSTPSILRLRLRRNDGQGAWSMEHGAWSMEHGAWGMEHGAWGMSVGGAFTTEISMT